MRYFLLFLLVLPLVSAAPIDWFQSEFVSAELNVSSVIDVSSVGPSPVVESVFADVFFVPKSGDFSVVRRFSASPSAVLLGDRVRFSWKSPGVSDLSFGYSSLVETANGAPRVRAKIPFPVSNSGTIDRYVGASKLIDSGDSRIVALARELASGEDDLFVLVSKVASWTKSNIQYNLSSLTVEASQPASWVLENRFGVCDEITSLFIALLRSLGVPARFVSGLAFTDSPEFPSGWGAHGWAEVYFVGVGWVPFDPTFGQFGWVDPGHIKLKESVDPSEPTAVYEWRARDVDFSVRDLNLSASLVGHSGSVPFELDVSVSPLRPRVGFNGFNGVVVDVVNLADYYVGSEFSLARVDDIAVVGSERQSIVLPPFGKGRLLWKVRVKGLDPKFQFEIPLVVSSSRGDVFRSSFVSGNWDVVFSSGDVDSSFEKLSVEKGVLDLACSLESDAVFESSGQVDCFVENSGLSDFSARVCSGSCSDVVVPASGRVPVSFVVPALSFGANEVVVSASVGNLSKRAVLTLVRLDTPNVVVSDVVVPSVVSYGDVFELRFRLSRESVSSPQGVSVSVDGGGASAVVSVGELTDSQDIVVNIDSSQLFSASPDFDIVVSFADVSGNSFYVESSAEVDVVGVPWYKKFFGWFVDLF